MKNSGFFTLKGLKSGCLPWTGALKMTALQRYLRVKKNSFFLTLYLHLSIGIVSLPAFKEQTGGC